MESIFPHFKHSIVANNHIVIISNETVIFIIILYVWESVSLHTSADQVIQMWIHFSTSAFINFLGLDKVN